MVPLLLLGDFNDCTLRSVLPKFYKNVSCITREQKTLDYVYTKVAEAYKVTLFPSLRQSHHLSLFLLPKYTPGDKCVICTMRTIKVWFKKDSILQHLLQHTDRNVFAVQATTDSMINTDTNSILDHVKKCVDRMTTYKEIKTFPNQKPWMNRGVRLLLKTSNASFRSGELHSRPGSRPEKGNLPG